MVKNCFRVNIVRRHLYDENTLFVQGCYISGEPQNSIIKVFLDDKEIEYKAKKQEGYLIAQKYANESTDIFTEIVMWVKLPEIDTFSNFRVVNFENDEEQVAFKCSIDKLKKIINRIDYNIDLVKKERNDVIISGWIIYKEKMSITSVDSAGRERDGELKLFVRKDVNAAYPEIKELDKKVGFEYKISAVREESIKLTIKSDEKMQEEVINISNKAVVKRSMLRKVISYARRNGIKKCIIHALKKIKQRIFKKSADVDGRYAYNDWIKKYDITKDELKRQRSVVFNNKVKFSIIIPLYNTPKNFLDDLIKSITNQTYSNWEICFADGSTNDELEKQFAEITKQDDRIKYKKLNENKGISGNTNEALKMANGDYVVLADHDDVLAENALFELAMAIEKNKDIDVLYSDEDKISMDGHIRFEPHFKPDFNIDLLCSVNYICHLFAAKKALVDRIGMFRQEYDGAQDYDFIFRCVENAKEVCHIPKVLYHWRSHLNSTAENPESKLYAFEAGKRAIQAHFDRIGIAAEVENGVAYGIYHSKIKVKDMPLVSILIPNKDHIDDLDKCIKSIYEKTSYKNYEIVIIENNSTEERTFEYYEKVTGKYQSVKVVKWEYEFNYSAINNFGVKHSNGEYLLFLNNDTEVINASWLEEMLGYCQREDVGIVGARLFYPDDTIQHAGVVIGFGGIAGHAFIGQARNELGYFARAMCTQDYSAVTAACMMTKREIFESVGGFTDELKVAFNDIDYCMKVREKDKLVVYNPYAELYHYESKSRGLEDTKEKIARFNNEIEIFQKKWYKILSAGDPFYNPNLSLNRSDFGLKR